MRAPGWSLTIVVFAAPALVAQQPPAGRPAQAPPAAAVAPPLNVPADDPLPALLQQWEQRMKAIQSIQADVVRTETDVVTKTQDVFEGTAKFLRPDRADLHLKKRGNPNAYERFLLTGNYLYEFVPKQKVVRVHQLPQRAPGQPAVDDNFMGLLSGMSMQEAQRRYELKLIPKPEDNWYQYLLVKPRLPADKAEFTEARLVLFRPDRPNALLPAQIEFVQPNGNPIRWDIKKIDVTTRLGPNDFAKPRLERDWQWVNVPAPGGAGAAGPVGPAPTKVRQSGGS
jgi:TIGR03009 family protein